MAREEAIARHETTKATRASQSEGGRTTVKAGRYELGHPDVPAVVEFLGRSTVAVWLSWHNGISLKNDSGKGWDNNLTLEQLRIRLENTDRKTQAAIVLEKNYMGENNEHDAVADLLTQIGFETIVVQLCHSSATIIEKIIYNSK